MTDELDDFFYDPAEEGLDLPVPATLRELPTPVVSEETAELLAFQVAGEDYAIDIGAVHEIVKPPPMTEVPRGPKAVLGVISLRGEALPVFDPMVLLGLKRPAGQQPGPSRRVVVLDTDEGLAGLQVDAVDQVVRLPRASVEPPPAVLGGGQGPVLGIGRWSGRLLAILDPVELLPERRR